LVVVKKRGSFEAHKEKGVYGCWSPQWYSPVFLLYYDIVAYFYIADSLNNGLFFWKYFGGMVWV